MSGKVKKMCKNPEVLSQNDNLYQHMHVLFCVDGDGEKCPEGFKLDEAFYCAGNFFVLHFLIK